jgi:energy-coupling factor transporter ATP-binding protein EcfA2
MAEIPLKNQIIDWLKECSYWFQYSGNRILEGENISDELVTSTYNLFKEDFNLKTIENERTEIIYNEISVVSTTTVQHLELQTIKEIENVNALASGQSIPINSNLTIIYGGNGTGKSGYIRLLNNAFNSRGDKNILPNVFKSPTGEPSCKFTFKSDSTVFDLQYPQQHGNVEFTQFSVFDTHSVKVLLEQDNKLNFTPNGFEFFDKIEELYEALKSKLNSEIIANRPANEFIAFFTNDNAIRSLIISLGGDSNEDVIKTLGSFSEQDATKLSELIAKREELKALDIPKKIAELQKLHSQLLEYIERQNIILEYSKTASIEEIKSLINSYHKLQELAKQQGIESLEEFNIEQLGSNEWKDFIKASRSYASLIETNRDNNAYPTNEDNCLFCLRPLTEKENNLINSYWKLLKSEAEAELNRTIQAINDLEKKIKELHPATFDESTTYFQYINTFNPEFANKWKAIANSSELNRQNIIQNLGNKTLDFPMSAVEVNTSDFNDLVEKLNNSILELFQKNPEKELSELEIEIQFYTDKSLLNKLLDKVLAFVFAHKWARKAESSASAFNTKSLTIKQGELFSYHITDKYTETFNEECEKLNAPKVVNIIQKNAKISTLRKLQVAGFVANSVLSEGEQRAISLSDFVTEVKLNPNNKGVFFDDPITSQDHDRREKIAERLVELSTQKQVIIFTHDIAFFIRLKIIAENINVNHTITTIRNAGGTPGIISPNLPWIAQNVKARIGTLKDRLVRLKKIEAEGNDDNYFYEAKGWYILLREAWERAVEERLFKGVVERFSIGVQTLKLKKVVINDELLSDIEKGMTESSNWLHDAGAGLNPTPPNTDKAESDWNFLNDFATKCVSA